MSRHSVEKLSKSLNVSPSTSQKIRSLKTVLSSRIAWLAFLLLAFGYAGSIFAQAYSTHKKRPAVNPQQLPQLLPREKEIVLALSAAPEHLRKGAGVYVLKRSGFVRVRDSANGFTCIVNRDHPLNQKPVCFDAEGTATILPKILRVGELLMQGKPMSEVDCEIEEGFRSGKYIFRRVAPALLTCSPATFATSIRAQGTWSRFPRISCFTHRT
jgi:hypothetical protein